MVTLVLPESGLLRPTKMCGRAAKSSEKARFASRSVLLMTASLNALM